MFGPAGVWYVYFIYGIHWMLNVVTDEVDHPAAVLLRGAGEWDGPARLTKALAIDKRLNGQPSAAASGLWIEDRGIRVPRGGIRRTPRIGVDYAGTWAARPYRFVLTDAARRNVPAPAARPSRRDSSRIG
jgi:DNA-3-methyladenine glycosylase